MMKSSIWITTKFEGIHQYINAPEGVEFLRQLHRHLFHVKVKIEVFHNERDIEFILFKRFIDSILKDNILGNMSCETISDFIYEKVKDRYPARDIEIEVSEDGENGSSKFYEKR